jgi:SNF2 family DNA or RNA helicase
MERKLQQLRAAMAKLEREAAKLEQKVMLAKVPKQFKPNKKNPMALKKIGRPKVLIRRQKVIGKKAVANNEAKKAEKAAAKADKMRLKEEAKRLKEAAKLQKAADKARKQQEKEEAEEAVLEYRTRPALVPPALLQPPLSAAQWMGHVGALEQHQKDAVCSSLASRQRAHIYQFGMGSGKTLTAITTAMQYGSAVGIVPATLKGTWEDEIRKWSVDPRRFQIVSYDEFYRHPIDLTGRFVFVDEAQALRSGGSKRARVIFNELRKAHKVAFLSGTPQYNHPTDISALLNPFRRGPGIKRLPTTAEAYEEEFGDNVDAFAKLVRDNVIYFKGGVDPTKYPTVVEKVVHLEATPHQQELYRALEEKNISELTKLDDFIAAKLGSLNGKQQAQVGQLMKKLTAFATEARQIPNRDNLSGPDAVPKIQYIVNWLKKHPKKRALVFSNYLESGLDQLAMALTSAGITFGAYTGRLSMGKRNELVKEYNSGKIRILLLSSAGGEGLDLKKTDMVFIFEPHWNWAKIRQAIGRAARRGSHPPNSTVEVVKFVTRFPYAKMHGIEEGMVKIADDKQRRIDAVNRHIIELSQKVVEARRPKCNLGAIPINSHRIHPFSRVSRHTSRVLQHIPTVTNSNYRAALDRARLR